MWEFLLVLAVMISIAEEAKHVVKENVHPVTVNSREGPQSYETTANLNTSLLAHFTHMNMSSLHSRHVHNSEVLL